MPKAGFARPAEKTPTEFSELREYKNFEKQILIRAHGVGGFAVEQVSLTGLFVEALCLGKV